METKIYSRLFAFLTIFFFVIDLSAQITGPSEVCLGSAWVSYQAPAGMSSYNWTVNGGGVITPGATNDASVQWTDPGTWQIGVSDGESPAIVLNVIVNPLPVPTITGPLDPVTQLPAPLPGGITLDQQYATETGMTGYTWSTSPAGVIKSGQGTAQIIVDWINVSSIQTVSVNYTDANGCAAHEQSVYIINYFPFATTIDPLVIPQFVDPLPHFAAGLRVNAKAGGALKIRTKLVQQVALSTGTQLASGIIGQTAGAGLGNYAAYQISKDNGVTWGPAMWPAQTIETMQGKGVTVQYENGLSGVTYSDFNILADQTLMMNGYKLTGDPVTQPYLGEIPMVVHLHGGEIPSNSDGGPNAWFTPTDGQFGPAFKFNASTLVSYPNRQEATTLWYHPHDDGLTRINVYTGLAGFYFIKGSDEEAAKLPGWSGDDKVREVTPPGKTTTFNGTNTYLPEIELAVQDRMFDVNGQLYWPVAPPNPEIHPFWTPEFVGNVMTVNGKSWPYLSVAPRKYRFRLLDGCNARWLNLWLVNASDGTPGPKITVIGTDGGLLSSPVDIDPAAGGTLTIGPGQRNDIIIDFTGIPAGTTFTLMNDAATPFPFGEPVVEGLDDRIMQFIVNGEMVSASNPAIAGADKSLLPANLRPVKSMVKLTDFTGNLSAGVTPVRKRQIILNEVMGPGGPAAVLMNNTYFDPELSIAGDPYRAGGPTEFMTEGTTEIIQIANVSADAHPLHIHLLQWQLVSRQPIDDIAYLDAYMAAWAPRNIPEFPAGMGYPGGGGTPNDYNTLNGDGAVGGNPAFSPFLLPGILPANNEEMGWKDNVTVLPGQVTTFVVRVAPTDQPVNAPPNKLLLPFDPSLGPGYVWHCHVIDHEDMSMMRPLMIQPSPLRLPIITYQPVPVKACINDAVSFKVGFTSMTPPAFQWQVSIDNGITWSNITNGGQYSGAQTSVLKISPATIDLTGNLYRILIKNTTGSTQSNHALLTVNECSIAGSVKYNNNSKDPLSNFTVSFNGKTAITDVNGDFIINGVSSGTYPIIVKEPTTPVPGGMNATDAGTLIKWFQNIISIPNVQFLAGDVNFSNSLSSADRELMLTTFVNGRQFNKKWVFWGASGFGKVFPYTYKITVNGTSVNGIDILGMCTGDFNGSFDPNSLSTEPNVTLSQSGITTTVLAENWVSVPLKAVSSMQVGAISLILNFPSKLLSLKEVVIPGSYNSAYHYSTGNELRIGWTSRVPVNVSAGQDLVILKFLLNPNTADQAFSITMVPDYRNEIADGNYNPINGAELTVDETELKNLMLNVFPNPAGTSTTASFQLPVAGSVTLSIRNSLGTRVISVIPYQFMDAGNYTRDINLNSLAPGYYYVKLTLFVPSENHTYVKTIVLIKK